ncbi:MAG: Gldg family protein [Deltaproteobacteria bacterium]|nr:Gldg family protein [Deltaproteobacteria bacterium]
MQKGDTLIQRGLLSFTGLLILLATLILVNVLVSFASVRLDATEENVYSLSDGTKKILSGLSAPVTLKIFYSRSQEQIPHQVKAYAARVKDFVKEYAYASDGMLKMETYDPKPDSDEEEWATRYGVEPMALPTGERVYFGMVAVSRDKEEVIPYLDVARENLLEYDITRMIYRLTQEEKPVVGVISSLPVFGTQPRQGLPPSMAPEPADAWYFISELKKIYEVRQIAWDKEMVDPKVDLLLVFHPKLPPAGEYLVDQYVLSGTNAMLFVDPVCVSDDTAKQRGRGARASFLDTVFNAWGIAVTPDKVAVDLDQPTRVRNQFNVVEDNPAWISVEGEYINSEDVITSGLESLLLPLPGSVTVDDGVELSVDNLLTTSEYSARMDAVSANLGARTIRNDFVSGETRLPLAVRIHGKFPAAFPDGPPENPASPQEKPLENENHLSEAQKEATVILVADCDMLADGYYLRRQNFLGYEMRQVFNDNLNFLLNSAELLTGGDALVSIRSRGRFERPFTKVRELEGHAQRKWLEKEKELMAALEETNEVLRNLEKQKTKEQQYILSPQQQAEVEKYREKRKRINDELKEVRKQLRSDIERLGLWVKFFNIFFMPIVVSLAGLAFGLYRQRKQK